jgi:serine/threonine-protein kinase
MENPSKIGRYEILEELGQGAMGTVYRAKDPAMDRVVALKTIISVVLASDQGTQFRERFYREARAAGALAHPGIVPVFDVGEHEGVPYLVMEFINGRTLSEVMKKGERLSLDRACEIGQKLAEALGYAHQHGVVHRDIKPANILLTSRETYGIERPKITDFGVAKMAEGRTTLTGQLVGTPAFMPPEQFLGGPIDGRADLFSLGVVLYWLATGEMAFPGESITAVSYKVVHTDPVPPRKLNPWVPAKLDSVIMKCLAKSPDERYQTGEEVALELGRIREEGKVLAARRGAPPETVAVADSDPNATLAGSVVMGAVAAKQALAKPMPQAIVSVAAGSNRRTRLVLGAAILVVAAAGGWSAWRARHHAAVQVAASATPATSVTPPQTAATPVASATVPQPVGASGQSAAEPTPETLGKATPEALGKASPKPITETVPASTVPASTVPASSVPAKNALAEKGSAAKKPAAKIEAKVEAKAKALQPPKAPVVAPDPEPAALDFDPKTLDPKQNARLKIDAKRAPAGVELIVEMNGKLYFRKTSAGSDAHDDELYVPPGVQEFRVTAKSGTVKKASNTVSAEFKAKKHITLRIELRNQGLGADSGIPQAIYPDTQVVVSLK